MSSCFTNILLLLSKNITNSPHRLAIEALRLVALRDRDEAVVQAAAHQQDIGAALEEIDEANEALEVFTGAGGTGTRDRGVGSGSPLPPV